MSHGVDVFTPQPTPLAGVRLVSARSSRAFDRHFHDEYGIGVVRRGAQLSASGRGQVEAVAGDVITVNPGEVHDGTPIDCRGREWHMIYFAPELLLTRLSSERALVPEFERPVVRDQRTARAVIKLFEAGSSPDEGAHFSFEQGLIELLGNLLVPVAARDASAPVDVAVDRIDADPAAELTIRELASDCDLSEYQFIRAFRRATGITPHAFVVQRRCMLARRLIASGAPLSDVAAASGFADQSHMNRCIKRYYGFTPGVFARSERKPT